uniref:Glycosyltransferase family 92 protein n=1 Tax=Kalanchoe fedtschenkoi TaxID=63787 RepID=A0A7N0V9S5_KALFE
MAKDKDGGGGDKKLFVGLVWNCAAELKLLLTALVVLCAIATFIQFLPARSSSYSISDLRFCLTSFPTPPPPPPSYLPSPSLLLLSTPPPTQQRDDEVLPNGVIKRTFHPYGAAAYNFIQMGAYRGGLNTFAIIGLSSKPLHYFASPTYRCEWRSHRPNTTAVTAAGNKMLTDWGYGRVYTVVVVNCTFSEPVGAQGSGGTLVLEASTGDRDRNLTDRIQALEEPPGSLDTSVYDSPPKYDFLYCGSSLYGNLSPQRMREWIAYHVRFFGPKSHFVIHDAGGIHPDVLEVLKPWMELGFVTLQDIREQERFDGYYHNQFLVVNDCLHRYKFMAKWIFFFDVDEFMYVPPKNTIKSVVESLSEYTQFTIEQMPMSNKICLSSDARKWGIEKLIFKDVKKGIRRDRKYAIQPRNVLANGVHMSQHIVGKTTHKTEQRIKYFHFHGTIADRSEPCRVLVNTSKTTLEDTPYVMDTTLRSIAGNVKKFEIKTIGHRLQKTRQ